MDRFKWQLDKLMVDVFIVSYYFFNRLSFNMGKCARQSGRMFEYF